MKKPLSEFRKLDIGNIVTQSVPKFHESGSSMYLKLKMVKSRVRYIYISYNTCVIN